MYAVDVRCAPHINNNRQHTILFLSIDLYIFSYAIHTHTQELQMSCSIEHIYLWYSLIKVTNALLFHTMEWHKSGFILVKRHWDWLHFVCMQFACVSFVHLLYTASDDSHSTGCIGIFLPLFLRFFFCFENTRYPSLNQCNVNSWFPIINWLLACLPVSSSCWVDFFRSFSSPHVGGSNFDIDDAYTRTSIRAREYHICIQYGVLCSMNNRTYIYLGS